MEFIEIIQLSFVGVLTGILSGFFGIGGGTILVPILIFLGYEMKDAIGISVLQMLMASLFGSYLNNKNGLIDLKLIVPIGIGGFVGAIGSQFFVQFVPSEFLEYLFLIFVIYAFFRVIKGNKSDEVENFTPPKTYILVLIGSGIGFFAISIGVGGSLLLVPILVGFFYYEIKKAIATGLFFVIFSSLSGVINFGLVGQIEYFDAMIIGSASLIGVLIGIQLGKITSSKIQKILLLTFYGFVVIFLISRILNLQ